MNSSCSTRRFLWYCSFGILLFWAIACENEIDLNTKSSPLPIVYCILDLNNDIQYVRIGRTYNGSSDYLNQVPYLDSLILPGFRHVYVEEWIEDQLSEIYYFSRIEKPIKDTGLFPVEALDIYKADFIPKSASKYVLYTYFPAQDKVISGETITIAQTQLIDPAPLHVREINFHPSRGYTIRWITAPYSGIYQGVFRIYYSEMTATETMFKSFDIILPIRYVHDSYLHISQEISPGSFFRGFAENISTKEGVSRELLHMDFTLFGAGEDLSLFVKAQMPTFWMNISQYSNLDNGFGVFSSTSANRIANLQFSVLTEYYLANDSLTRALNFKDPYQ